MMDKVGNKAAQLEIAMIKVAAPRMALKIIDDAIQAHGGAGVSEDFGLARIYARIRTLRLADGPDEVHNRADRPAGIRALHQRPGGCMSEPRRLLRREAGRAAPPDRRGARWPPGWRTTSRLRRARCTVQQFKGGQSNPTYRLDTPGQAYVLRRKPFGPLLPSAHAVEREFRVIARALPRGLPGAAALRALRGRRASSAPPST